MKRYKLILLDVDGTLTHPHETKLMHGVARWAKHGRKANQKVALVTNQGGVGLRLWREVVREQGGDIGDPAQGPTEEQVRERISSIAAAVGADAYYISYRYQSKKGNWSPAPTITDCGTDGKSEPIEWEIDDPAWSKEWRKPAPGMLIQAMSDFRTKPAATLMVGNSADDKAAALAAGCDYMHTDEFFGPYRPIIQITYNPVLTYAWLDHHEGIDEEATAQHYEAMLKRCADIYQHNVIIKRKAQETVEEVKVRQADDDESAASVIHMVYQSIGNEWINRTWLQFHTPEQHLDALIKSNAIQQIIIASLVMRDVYGNDVAVRCAAKFAEAEAHKSKYRLVLG